MKFRIPLLFLLAVAVAACNKESKDDNKTDDGGGTSSAIPEVTFSEITSSSFKAQWNDVSGADSYRYEVTYTTEDGGTVAVAADNIIDKSFVLEALKPATSYEVKVAARSGGKTSLDKFVGTVSTAGNSDVTFSITPVEKYDEEDGYVYPVAQIVSSDKDVYYWVGAVPSDSKDDAVAWIEDDIAYYLSWGVTWEDLVAVGLVMKGDGESLAFKFTSYDSYYFTVAGIEKTMAGISVFSAVSYSYEFWAESPDTQIMHTSAYDDFLGDWMLTTNYTIVQGSDGKLTDAAGEIFPVRIEASADGNGFNLTGWGGTRNKFSSSPLKLDFVPADDAYNTFDISFPQNAGTEGGVTWQYVSWFNFVGELNGENVNLYLPYDNQMYETAPDWSAGFYGYIANENKTVMKIMPHDYESPEFLNEGAYMMGLWLYGTDQSGTGYLYDSKYAEPAAFYFLTRKDVADGTAVLPIPDLAAEGASISAASAAPHVSSVRDAYGRKLPFSL